MFSHLCAFTCRFAATTVISSEEAYTEHLSVAQSPCLSFRLRPFGQCVPAAGICVADCLMHHCVVVPKAGNVTVAMFKDEAHQSTSGLGTDVLQVRNQIPAATLMPGGDLAKC